MTRPAVIIWRIGPYHRARMSALQARCGAALAIEVCAQDQTYAWELQDGDDPFARVTLFDREAEVRAAALRAKINAALASFQPDVIAVPGWGDPAALLALDWARRHSVPCVLMSDSRAEDAPRNAVSEKIKALVVRSASAGLVAGKGHRDYLVSLGFPAERVALGYDVVDNAHFEEGAVSAAQDPDLRTRLGLPQSFFLVLSRLVPKKNLLVLLEAYARYRTQVAHPHELVIAGSGPLAYQIASQKGEGVELRPFAPYEGVPAYLALAQGLVLASTVEQWGLVVNEAMAAGCPPLVSSHAGAAELIRDGANGFLADPTVEGLCEGLTRLGAADRATIGTAAQRDIADWGPDRFAEGLLLAAANAEPAQRLMGYLMSPVLRALAHKTMGAGAGA